MDSLSQFSLGLNNRPALNNWLYFSPDLSLLLLRLVVLKMCLGAQAKKTDNILFFHLLLLIFLPPNPRFHLQRQPLETGSLKNGLYLGKICKFCASVAIFWKPLTLVCLGEFGLRFTILFEFCECRPTLLYRVFEKSRAHFDIDHLGNLLRM